MLSAVFGELSKKLAEVWKAMPEKDKLVSFLSFVSGNITVMIAVAWCIKCPVFSVQVWRQKAQYLQHKQNKAEATTVKHKSATESKSKGIVDSYMNVSNSLSSHCQFS